MTDTNPAHDDQQSSERPEYITVPAQALREVLDYLHDSEADHYDPEGYPEDAERHVYRFVLAIEEHLAEVGDAVNAALAAVVYALEVERDRSCMTFTEFVEKHGRELAAPLGYARWQLITAALEGVGRPARHYCKQEAEQLALFA